MKWTAVLFATLIFTTTALAQEPFRVGMVASLSGPASMIGQPIRDVAVMAEETINAGGGIAGRPLKLIIEDDGGDPSRAVLAVQKLIKRDRVLAILGPTLTPTAMAVIPIAEEEGTPLITIVGSRRVVVPAKKWIFKVSLADDIVMQVTLEHMRQEGIKRLALLTDSTSFGEAGRALAKGIAPGFGLAISADEKFPPGDRDMTVQLTRIRQSDSQALLVWTVGPAAVIIAKNYKQLGMRIPIYQSHGTVTKSFIQLAGEASEGNLMPAVKLMVLKELPQNDPQRGLLEKFTQLHEKKYGPITSQFGIAGWDAVNLMAEALRRAGADRARINEFIEKARNFQGLTGTFSYSPEDHDGLKEVSVVMVRVKGGDFTLAR